MWISASLDFARFRMYQRNFATTSEHAFDGYVHLAKITKTAHKNENKNAVGTSLMMRRTRKIKSKNNFNDEVRTVAPLYNLSHLYSASAHESEVRWVVCDA